MREAKKTEEAAKGTRARERQREKDVEGSNMRRKRRLETFQTVFPALVIKV